jgi:hypothetical protein
MGGQDRGATAEPLPEPVTERAEFIGRIHTDLGRDDSDAVDRTRAVDERAYLILCALALCALEAALEFTVLLEHMLNPPVQLIGEGLE